MIRGTALLIRGTALLIRGTALLIRGTALLIWFLFWFQANVNGRVLSQCNIDELKKEMSMNFGDWQLFRAMVSSLTQNQDRTGPGPDPGLTQNRSWV